MTNAERDMAFALERVFGSEQSLESGCVIDVLQDLGWTLTRAPMPGQYELPYASTRGLGKRASA